MLASVPLGTQQKDLVMQNLDTELQMSKANWHRG